MFQFSEYKEGLYRNLNPSLRIVIPIILTIVAFMYQAHIILIGMILLVVSLLFLAKVSIATIIKYGRMLLTIIPFISIIWIFFHSEGNVVYQFYFIKVYEHGLEMAGIMALRFTSVILAIPLLLGGITQEEFVIGLRKLKIPRSISIIITMVFKLLPTMESDMAIIKQAQMSRGIEFENIKMREKVKNYVMLFVPLLTLTINRMETLSKVIECRGVTYKGKKSFYKNIKYKFLDYLILLIVVGLFTVAIYYRG